MIRFSNHQIKKAEILFKLLRMQTTEYLKENDISPCDNCDGTGLAANKLNGYGGYSWSEINGYCDKCYGVGYLGYHKNLDFDGEKYICSKCQSVGCEDCNHTGFVDWITHIMGKEKK